MTKLRFDHALRIKVTLEGLRPAVWRRIEIPCTATFWDFHVAIQDAMGWDDSHLHLFNVKLPLSDEKYQIGIYDDGLDPMDSQLLMDWNVLVAEVLTLVSRRCEYLYDFGDDWRHRLLLEKIVPREVDTAYPRCLGGKNACPPEDVGGVWGYRRMLDSLADPKDEEHEEWSEWLPAEFDPTRFDPSAVVFHDPELRLREVFGEYE